MDIRKQKQAQKKEIVRLEKLVALAQNKMDHIDNVIEGDVPSDEQQKKIKSQKFSFGVIFERRKVLKKVRSPGALCKSVRRFTSKKEAVHHGKRFSKIHKHKGFALVRVNKRANAWVNWLTGKTNPAI